MRILVVEDNAKLAAHLKKGLAEHGYVVDVASDGVDGKHLAVEGDYDLVVLDMMLPGIDGFGVLRALRQVKATPVLILTARAGIEDRVRGLEEGADDYLVKPFAFVELLARIRALLRRRARTVSDELAVTTLGNLELDLTRRRVYRAGRRIDLTAQEFALFALLMRRRGEVLSRAVLTEQLWDMSVDRDSNVIDVAIRRLRAKIDEPFPEKVLHTVRGVGYVLEVREQTKDGNRQN